MILQKIAFETLRVVLLAGAAYPVAVWLALPTIAWSADKLLSTVKVETPYVSPKDEIRLSVKDGQTQPVKAELQIIRSGNVHPVDNTAYQPAKGQAPALVTGTINDNMPYGTYTVQAVLDSQSLTAPDKVVVGPQGGGVVTLNQFDPAGTYGTTPFFDSKLGEFNTVQVLMRGTGFLFSDSKSEQAAVGKYQGIVIWINGVRQDIIWDDACGMGELGTKAAPKDHHIYAKVNSAEEALLCYVPVSPDGHLMFAAGFGDSPGKSELLSVFLLNGAEVAIISAVVALILGLLPLLLLSFVQKSVRIGGSDYRLRMLFLDLETNTYSLSKLQFYMWTVAAIFAYSYLFIGRVYVQHSSTWPDVPANLPGIILVAAGTAVGSQIVTAARGSKGAGDENPSLADFITSGGVVAPDRLQMLLWTFLGIGTGCCSWRRERSPYCQRFRTGC